MDSTIKASNDNLSLDFDEKVSIKTCDKLIFEFNNDKIEIERDSHIAGYPFFRELFENCLNCEKTRPTCKKDIKELTNIDLTLSNASFGFSSTSEGWLVFKNAFFYLNDDKTNESGLDPLLIVEFDKIYKFAYYVSKGNFNYIPIVRSEQLINFYIDVRFNIASLYPEIAEQSPNILFEANRDYNIFDSNNLMSEIVEKKYKNILSFVANCANINPIACKALIDFWIENEDYSNEDYLMEIKEKRENQYTRKIFIEIFHDKYWGDNSLETLLETDYSDVYENIFQIILISLCQNSESGNSDEMFSYLYEEKYVKLIKKLSAVIYYTLVTYDVYNKLGNNYMHVDSLIKKYMRYNHESYTYDEKSRETTVFHRIVGTTEKVEFKSGDVDLIESIQKRGNPVLFPDRKIFKRIIEVNLKDIPRNIGLVSGKKSDVYRSKGYNDFAEYVDSIIKIIK